MKFGDQTYRIRYLPLDGGKLPKGMSEDDYGFTDYENGVIYVRRSPSPSRTRATRNHEFLHAAIEASAAEKMLVDAAKALGLDPYEFNEAFVRALAPALDEAFKR
jgi:hypothetical protein